MIKEAIIKLTERKDLTFDEVQTVMNEIVNNQASPSQIAAFLTALKMKGETPSEIVSFARILKSLCLKLQHSFNDLVDTAGTGGDKVKTFNVSTATAFVLAASNIKVAKHGNRAVTGNSGSADVLEEFGINIYLGPKEALECLERINLCFLFAPLYHTATKNVATVRKEIGIKTIFNILGPLTNPANVNRQVVGVYEPSLVYTIANALKSLNVKKACVVHGLEGIDEFSISSNNLIAFIEEGEIDFSIFDITEIGYKKFNTSDLICNSPKESAKVIYDILSGKESLEAPKSLFLKFNAALGFIVAGKARDLKEGIQIAEETIKSGKPFEILKEFVVLSKGNIDKFESFEKNV
jgi:anthranilate phosphoribosyltransferase